MNSKILCNWLGIMDWPPDHYALLGLKPGEGNASCIEQHVQERMAKLRCYQLSYPDEATEGMNRVAQAFICLTDALAKAPALEKKNGEPAKKGILVSAGETRQLTTAGDKTDVDWKKTPPPVRIGPDQSGISKGLVVPSPPAKAKTDLDKSASSHPAPIDFGSESSEPRRGLGTLPALIERIHQTRQFLIAWKKAGKFLSKPGKTINKSSEEATFTHRLNHLFELNADFPKIIGHPGQPGYRVLAMARLEMTVQMFAVMDMTQRENLARDWDAGYRVLLAYRRFLHVQFKLLRRGGPVSLVWKGVRGAINDHPLWVTAAVLLCVAVCVLFFRKLV